jgi:hypothetical protein
MFLGATLETLEVRMDTAKGPLTIRYFQNPRPGFQFSVPVDEVSITPCSDSVTKSPPSPPREARKLQRTISRYHANLFGPQLALSVYLVSDQRHAINEQESMAHAKSVI